MADLDTSLRAILRSYGTRQHWKESTAAGTVRYALFHEGKQVGETGTHREIQDRREDRIIADIKALFAQQKPKVAKPNFERLGLGSAE